MKSICIIWHGYLCLVPEGRVYWILTYSKIDKWWGTILFKISLKILADTVGGKGNLLTASVGSHRF